MQAASSQNTKPTWILVPGGPGLKSSYLSQIGDHLKAHANVRYFDFPTDELDLGFWKNALLEFILATPGPVQVFAHSFGAMFLLGNKEFGSTELEEKISRLVLVSSAPNRAWTFMAARAAIELRKTLDAKPQQGYVKNPTSENLLKLLVSWAPYYFASDRQNQGRAFLRTLECDSRSYNFAQSAFLDSFEFKWVPENIPTLIISGAKDRLTPTALFLNEKRFQLKNILLKDIADAGHFPWIDQPESFFSSLA